MKGGGDGIFDPQGKVTVAQIITIAVRLNSIYRGLGDSFPTDEPWYQPYVKYALMRGMLTAGEFDDLDESATRAQMVHIFFTRPA